ncbi:MAG: metallophosphoesterase family protein [Thermoplasmata archaeon]|nr:metallophosphoesterase family protein [Thermoplasmata archaeon]
MKLLAFSDWRIHSIEKLIEYLQGIKEKPDFIIYAGEDISRFINYFEKIASFSKYGLLVVAGNDEPPIVKSAISGKNVYDLHRKPIFADKYCFIGLEGATSPPGILLYSEKEVWLHLNQKMNEIPDDKEIIIISHTPPYGLLDVGIRFGIGHKGSKSLLKFIDKYTDRIRAVVCGHIHSQGGKITKYKHTLIINCASLDIEGEPGKLAIIYINGDTKIEWEYIYEWGPTPKEFEDLMKIPLVGYSRAKILMEAGIKSAEEVARLSPEHELAKHPYFKGVFELIINYAKAIIKGKPIVVGKHPFFENLADKDIYFLMQNIIRWEQKTVPLAYLY